MPTAVQQGGSGGGAGGGLANIVEDLTPQLGADLDVNSFSIVGFEFNEGFYNENGHELLLFTAPASPINYIEIAVSAVGDGVTVVARGDDTDVDLQLFAKGAGLVKALNSFDVAGNITLTGTVDGEDIQTLKAESEFCFFADAAESDL